MCQVAVYKVFCTAGPRPDASGSHCPVLTTLALLWDHVNCETDEAGEAEGEDTHVP